MGKRKIPQPVRGMKVRDVLPVLTLTIGLTIGLGAIFAAGYRVDVMRNWDARRCEPGVVAIAGSLKPSTDPRTRQQFAADNWSFCQKEYVQDALRAAAAVPKELAAAEGAVVSMVRDITGILADVFVDVWQFCYEAYSAFMDRMKGAAKLMHNFMIQLHSIVERLQASVLSIIFGLISLITAFISATQLILIVAIVILGIIVALQIILFFLLFPISSLILTVTAIISVVVVVIVTAIAAAMVAEMFTPGACFAAGTRVLLGNGHGSSAPIESVRIGDTLRDGGVVTAVHRFRQPEQLYMLDGVRVTGDHLIQSPERAEGMIHVRDHPEATPVGFASQTHDLWCLTTTTRRIPIQGYTQAHIFADWEEIPDTDTGTQAAWYRAVWRSLNPEIQAPPPRAAILEADAGLAPDCPVLVAGWFGRRSLRRAEEVALGDWLVTREGQATRVLGRVEIVGDQETDAMDLGDGIVVSAGTWVRAPNEIAWRPVAPERARDAHPVRWIHLYTTAGEFQIGSRGVAVRDASEVGLGGLTGIVDRVILGVGTREK